MKTKAKKNQTKLNFKKTFVAFIFAVIVSFFYTNFTKNDDNYNFQVNFTLSEIIIEYFSYERIFSDKNYSMETLIPLSKQNLMRQLIKETEIIKNCKFKKYNNEYINDFEKNKHNLNFSFYVNSDIKIEECSESIRNFLDVKSKKIFQIRIQNQIKEVERLKEILNKFNSANTFNPVILNLELLIGEITNEIDTNQVVVSGIDIFEINNKKISSKKRVSTLRMFLLVFFSLLLAINIRYLISSYKRLIK